MNNAQEHALPHPHQREHPTEQSKTASFCKRSDEL